MGSYSSCKCMQHNNDIHGNVEKKKNLHKNIESADILLYIEHIPMHSSLDLWR